MQDGMIVQFFNEYVQFSIIGAMMPTMIVVFILAILVRLCLYYTAKKEQSFVDGVGVRAYRYLEEEDHETKGFHETAKIILDRTYEELFIRKKVRRKRAFDRTSSFLDRIFSNGVSFNKAGS